MSRVGLFGQISDINDHLFLSGAGVMRPEKLKQKVSKNLNWAYKSE